MIGISFVELLNWNHEAAKAWKAHLDLHPHLLTLDCGIGGAANVQVFIRHIWGAEMRWSQRIAGLPVTGRESMAGGPLDALFSFHLEAVKNFRALESRPDSFWEEPYRLGFDWIPEERQNVTRRKLMGHALLHSQRHFAQLATIVRMAGHPTRFQGDLLFSGSLQ